MAGESQSDNSGAPGGQERARWPINITEVGIQNIYEKHTEQGPYSAGKSIFTIPEGMDLQAFVEQIVRPAEDLQPELQPMRDTYRRVVAVDTEESIGWDEFGSPEWRYTVLTADPEEPTEGQDLFNAFPGA